MAKASLPPIVGVDHPAPHLGAVTVFGTKYDFDRVLFAYMQLIDQLTQAFGKTSVVIHGNEFHHWPATARAFVSAYWRERAAAVDVSFGGLQHVFRGFRAHAYLLGFDRLVANEPPAQGFANKDPADIDSRPRIVFFGIDKYVLPFNGGFGERSTLPAETSLAIVSVLEAQECKLFGFATEPGPVTQRTLSAPRQDLLVTFPREIYSDGQGYLRVRCLRLDGSEYRMHPRDLS